MYWRSGKAKEGVSREEELCMKMQHDLDNINEKPITDRKQYLTEANPDKALARLSQISIHVQAIARGTIQPIDDP